MDNDKEFEQALFRFSLISPLLHIDDETERKNIMRTLVNREHDIPYSEKRQVTVKTLENYLRRYNEDGFDGLKRQRRNDKKVLKSMSNEVFDKIVALKKEEPRRSARQIIRIIEALPEHEGVNLKERTVSRILKNNGLTRKDLKPKKIHQSFEMDTINDLWETDISDGLYLQRTKEMTYCFAFIDDHSRLIPHAQFYSDEKLPRLEDCLKKAILKRGTPKAIYADNGKVFVSTHLKRICAELGIRLIHHLPYSPQSKGKIERFFLRMKKEFLIEARAADLSSIDELNSYFHSWLEVEYHRKEHHGIGTTPLQRFTRELSRTKVRRVESMEEITEIFLYREKRKVGLSNGAIKLNGNIYSSPDVSLLGKNIEVRFDPYDMSRIYVYYEGSFVHIAYPRSLSNTVYQKVPEESNTDEKQIRSSSIEFFTRLKQKEQEILKKESASIDFTKLNKKEKENNG